MLSKSFCEDITEGKFSFPIIHAVRTRPEDTRLLHILRMRTEELHVKRCAVDWVTKCGSLAYTRGVLRELLREVGEHLQLLGGHERLWRILSALDLQLDETDSTNDRTSDELNAMFASAALSAPVVEERRHQSEGGPAEKGDSRNLMLGFGSGVGPGPGLGRVDTI